MPNNDIKIVIHCSHIDQIHAQEWKSPFFVLIFPIMIFFPHYL